MSKTNGCVVSKEHSRAWSQVVRARFAHLALTTSTDRSEIFEYWAQPETIGFSNFLCYWFWIHWLYWLLIYWLYWVLSVWIVWIWFVNSDTVDTLQFDFYSLILSEWAFILLRKFFLNCWLRLWLLGIIFLFYYFIRTGTCTDLRLLEFILLLRLATDLRLP